MIFFTFPARCSVGREGSGAARVWASTAVAGEEGERDEGAGLGGRKNGRCAKHRTNGTGTSDPAPHMARVVLSF